MQLNLPLYLYTQLEQKEIQRASLNCVLVSKTKSKWLTLANFKHSTMCTVIYDNVYLCNPYYDRAYSQLQNTATVPDTHKFPLDARIRIASHARIRIASHRIACGEMRACASIRIACAKCAHMRAFASHAQKCAYMRAFASHARKCAHMRAFASHARKCAHYDAKDA